ncbi:antiporter [Sporosarcina sp. P13]|uniref:VLRF1 family aeRF1-type release factor n=1 Tax=Sporosarcina sp. P13 TaxID=2048263 RepID=UPI000C16628F|nr:VLRF1 family aeRF1-type release factor [Sporosarcina sp. P13]PIC64568.1 antiporter [Sporosarcina sp. P13]
MSICEDVKKLKAFRCDDRCVLSVYLNTNPADPEQQQAAWRIHLKSGLKRLDEYLVASGNEKELTAYRSVKDRVMKEVEDKQNDLAKGVVIFAAADPEIWSVHYVQVAVKTSFHWENHAMTEELEYMLKAYPEAGIILPSYSNVRILDTAMGRVHDEVVYEFDSGLDVWKEQKGVQSSIQRGVGGHTDGFDIRLKENLDRFYKDMGAVVGKMKAKRGWKEIHVAGEAELAKSFSSILREKPESCIHKNFGKLGNNHIIQKVFESR